MTRFVPLVALLVAFALASLRAEDPPSVESRLAAAQKLAEGLDYQDGEIALRDGLAKIKLPPEFRYLDGKDAQIVLSKIWSNPDSGNRTLGMIVPKDTNLLSPEAWVVVVTYEEEGYVKDDDAAKINYDDLLKQMQERVRKANEEREKQGFESIELVGWAEPPHYDSATHKLYWAKRFRFGSSTGDAGDTLNYDFRLLGRRGVLVLNAVASIDQLPAVDKAAPTILSMVDFQEGSRYADFKPGTDKVATYGLAALIAGGVLAKTGALKGLLALLFAAKNWLLGLLLAGKKVVIVAVAAIAAAIKKFFNKVTGRGDSTTSS
jgi:uncharacterized membrane-anchored protein